MSDNTDIINIDVSKEMEDSFLEYSMSVIVSRALPDVRDGLKPVQRRILYSMHESNMTPDKGYHKCARVVGAVMGALHPHGDSAIYEALVRLAQPFSLRLPLIDGHGNFGSLDDGPAASRYTECRLDKSAILLTNELDEDTVDFKPNYDGRETEPVVLPSRFPNLLVNGTTGIAVGMATNMPPHNLKEVTSGLLALLENPDLQIDDLMQFIQAPDFPSGGELINMEGVKEGYRTGRGQFKIRGACTITDVTPKRKGIVITELPYGVGPEKIIARVKDLINAKRLQGVSDIKDYSDRKTGLKLVVECKTGFNPEKLLLDLYRLTQLEESFNVNNVALVKNQPQTLNLLQLCKLYLEHRVDVTTRRTEYRRNKAEKRAHIVEGLVKALVEIDEVVKIIKSSKDSATARAKLMQSFTLTEIQAEAILEMTLRRLTSLEVTKLKNELKDLHKIIKELTTILTSDKVLKNLIASELSETCLALETPRRTRINRKKIEEVAASAEVDAVIEDLVLVTYADGKQLCQNPGLKIPLKNKVITTLELKSNTILGVVDKSGTMHKVNPLELPIKPFNFKDYLNLKEHPLGIFVIKPDLKLIIVTSLGVLKVCDLNSIPQRSSSFSIITIKPNDSIVSVSESKSDDFSFIMVSSNAQLLKINPSKINPQGLSAAGVAGFKLAPSHKVIAGCLVSDNFIIVTQSSSKKLKASLVKDYPEKGRGTSGMRCQAVKPEEVLTSALVFEPSDTIIDSELNKFDSFSLVKRDAPGQVVDYTIEDLIVKKP